MLADHRRAVHRTRRRVLRRVLLFAVHEPGRDRNKVVGSDFSFVSLDWILLSRATRTDAGAPPVQAPVQAPVHVSSACV